MQISILDEYNVKYPIHLALICAIYALGLHVCQTSVTVIYSFRVAFISLQYDKKLFKNYYYYILSPHPAAAEPPRNVCIDRDPANAHVVIVTWSKPPAGVSVARYLVFYTVNGIQQMQSAENNSATPGSQINVNTTDHVDDVSVFTLSDQLPSVSSIYSET